MKIVAMIAAASLALSPMAALAQDDSDQVAGVPAAGGTGQGQVIAGSEGLAEVAIGAGLIIGAGVGLGLALGGGDGSTTPTTTTTTTTTATF